MSTPLQVQFSNGVPPATLDVLEADGVTVNPSYRGAGTGASANPPTVLTNLATGTVVNAGQLYVQNQSAAVIQIVLTPGANQTIILISPGGGANQQGGDWQAAVNAPWFVGPFTVNGPAGSQVGVIFN